MRREGGRFAAVSLLTRRLSGCNLNEGLKSCSTVFFMKGTEETKGNKRRRGGGQEREREEEERVQGRKKKQAAPPRFLSLPPSLSLSLSTCCSLLLSISIKTLASPPPKRLPRFFYFPARAAALERDAARCSSVTRESLCFFLGTQKRRKKVIKRHVSFVVDCSSSLERRRAPL